MHEFVVEHDEYTVAKQLYHHQYTETEHALLFHVEGPVASYRDAIQNISSVIEFAIAPCSDRSFYLYVREQVTQSDRELIESFSQPGLILAPPIEYRSDKTIRMVVIGPTDAIQSAADTVAEITDVEVERIGGFPSSRLDSRVGVTQRQFDAVTAAVDCGYYEVPKEGSIDDVADRLDCSTGTAGELLRRAEHEVMADLVADDPF
jgi:predicted DNA binding protein